MISSCGGGIQGHNDYHTSIVSSIFLNVITRDPRDLLVAASRGGQICWRTFTMRLPKGVVKPKDMVS